MPRRDFDALYRPGHQAVGISFTLPGGLGDLNYDLQLSTDLDFENLILDTSSDSATSGAITRLLSEFIPADGSVYRWRVRCRDGFGQVSPWILAPIALQTSFRFDLHDGWNLVAPPVDTDQTPAEIFPDAVLPLWWWNAEERFYVAIAGDVSLAAGTAYWVWQNGDDFSASFTGLVPEQFPPFVEGWNLVGESPTLEWDVDDQTGDSIWYWQDGYTVVPLDDLLQAPPVWFTGYWLYQYPAP